MPRPSNIYVEHVVSQVVREVTEALNSGARFARLRNSSTGAESIKNHFQCGSQVAHDIYRRAGDKISGLGYVKRKAAMGRQWVFYKSNELAVANSKHEARDTIQKFTKAQPRGNTASFLPKVAAIKRLSHTMDDEASKLAAGITRCYATIQTKRAKSSGCMSSSSSSSSSSSGSTSTSSSVSDGSGHSVPLRGAARS